MEVYNLEKVECPKCGKRWLTNVLSQKCVMKACDQLVDYELDRVKDAA